MVPLKVLKLPFSNEFKLTITETFHIMLYMLVFKSIYYIRPYIPTRDDLKFWGNLEINIVMLVILGYTRICFKAF